VSAADLVAGLLWLSLTAYAVLAGADFGGGVWDALAAGPRALEQRRAVAQAMGPVWEANHVWLIFMITGLFTAFPFAFATLASRLYLPLTLALVGIVLRGAAFVFRAHGREAVGPLTAWGAIFGAASMLAPFFLGTVAAAVATGTIHPFLTQAQAAVATDMFEGWTTPEAIAIGLFAVSLCAYLAATYLMVETEDRPALQADFRRRAIVAGLVSGALALLALLLVALEAQRLFQSLTGRGLPLLILAMVNGPVALWAVWRTRPRIARVAVVAQVVLVLWAWVAGQWPYLIPPDLTIASAAAPSTTLNAMLVVVGVGMALLLPSLWLLFRVFKSKNPAAGY
jgi:cytochrome bd ubiquinol oxidase subunit II